MVPTELLRKQTGLHTHSMLGVLADIYCFQSNQFNGCLEIINQTILSGMPDNHTIQIPQFCNLECRLSARDLWKNSLQFPAAIAL